MCWNTRPLRGTLTMFLIMTYYDDKFVFSIWLTIDVKFVQCLHSSRDCNWYQPRTNLQWFFVHIGRTIEQQMTSIRIWISTWIITDQSPIFGIIISLPIKLPLKKTWETARIALHKPHNRRRQKRLPVPTSSRRFVPKWRRNRSLSHWQVCSEFFAAMSQGLVAPQWCLLVFKCL